ncbi:MAG: 2-hydroxyacid dehydrogenase [Phycisphaerales bacterium JB037]
MSDSTRRGGALVVVTRRVPGEVRIEGAEVRQGPDDAMSRAALLEHVRGAAIIVSMYNDGIDDELLDAAGDQLRGICQFAVGVNNIDFDACKRRGVIVTNTPDAVTEGTADLAWSLVLAVARRVAEGDRFVRSGAYERRGVLGMAEFMGVDLTGRTLHIVGAGRIGFATAMRSIGWGMKVIYTARKRHWDFELAPLAAERVSLEEGLARADVVSLHTPLTPETKHLINAERLRLMKPNAILVNTARGPVVHEAALVEALRAKRIYGAGLDVYEFEPKVDDGLKELDNCVLTPHIGSAEERYRVMMTEMVCANASAILAGRDAPNRVG